MLHAAGCASNNIDELYFAELNIEAVDAPGEIASLKMGGDGIQPLSDPDGNWQLQNDFSDEFNDINLDIEKWNNKIKSWGTWSWKDYNVWVEDGVLKIQMEYDEHLRPVGKDRVKTTLFYKSGIIKSNAQPIKYGYFEARIKAAPFFRGVTPAFWAYNHEPDLWTEIDFVELLQSFLRVRDHCHHVQKHPDLDAPLHRCRYSWGLFDPRTEFHVYATEWNEEFITWYVDGKRVNRIRNQFWHQPLDVVLSMGLRWPLTESPQSEGFPTVMQVDYVRVFK